MLKKFQNYLPWLISSTTPLRLAFAMYGSSPAPGTTCHGSSAAL
ncbi:hypothetical protein [Chitinophaga sp. sic0106]|nr:hypothetical protein [Chitinophaga sp. sic0106]